MSPRSAKPTAVLTALVVDDEAPSRNEIAFLLNRDSRVRKVIESSSATDALARLQENRVDVAFLDVSMPEQDGLSLAKALKRSPKPPAVVFITAHDQHALEAFEVNAVDYVLKPVRESRLTEAVGRISALKARTLDDDQFTVDLAGRTRVVRRRDVLYVEAQGDYVRFHTRAESHLMRSPLITIEEQWRDWGFVRIHRAVLVALPHVSEISMSGGKCTVVVAGRELAVSRRHAKTVRDLLKQSTTVNERR